MAMAALRREGRRFAAPFISQNPIIRSSTAPSEDLAVHGVRTVSTQIDYFEAFKSKMVSYGSSWFSHLKRLNGRQNLPSPCLSFQRFVHYDNAKQAENQSSFRPSDYVRGALEEYSTGYGGSPRNNAEQNADVLRITMLRNNTFVTLTDSKGQKKKGGVCASAGTLPDKGGKDSRYSAEAAAEHVGREAQKVGVKSVVVKVSGFTNFKKKRQAIMAFKEGYNHGRRGDQTPVVYIEDKTRLAHNGCRKRKKRRI